MAVNCLDDDTHQWLECEEREDTRACQLLNARSIDQGSGAQDPSKGAVLNEMVEDAFRLVAEQRGLSNHEGRRHVKTSSASCARQENCIQESSITSSSYHNAQGKEQFIDLIDMAFNHLKRETEHPECQDRRMEEATHQINDRITVRNSWVPPAHELPETVVLDDMVDDAFRLLTEQRLAVSKLQPRPFLMQPESLDTPFLFPCDPLPVTIPILASASYSEEGQVAHDIEINSEQPSVFLTYVYSATCWPIVLDIARTLRHSGFYVRLDAFERHLISQCRTDWYKKCIEDSDFVIVCVDVSYKYKLEHCDPNVIQSEGDQSLADSLFVYNQLQTKYIGNGCTNFNIIPLIIDDAPFCSLPLWLQNTKVYSWPVDQEKLAKRIRRD